MSISTFIGFWLRGENENGSTNSSQKNFTVVKGAELLLWTVMMDLDENY